MACLAAGTCTLETTHYLLDHGMAAGNVLVSRGNEGRGEWLDRESSSASGVGGSALGYEEGMAHAKKEFYRRRSAALMKGYYYHMLCRRRPWP